ncbi:MAG: hypothetical protein ACC618_03200 [Patescibacteria group bacterium]
MSLGLSDLNVVVGKAPPKFYWRKGVSEKLKMSKERDIHRANKVLRKFRSRIGSRRSRIHKDTMESNLQKQNALDGLCGDCKNLKIKIRGGGVARSVELYCTKKHIPVELYAGVPLGQKADCPDSTPRN